MVAAGPGSEEYGADREATDEGYVATAYGAGYTDVLPESYQQDSSGVSGKMIAVVVGFLVVVGTVFGGT